MPPYNRGNKTTPCFEELAAKMPLFNRATGNHINDDGDGMTGDNDDIDGNK